MKNLKGGIEELVFNQYELLFKDYKGYDIGGINTDFLSSKRKSFIIEKSPELFDKLRSLSCMFHVLIL
jgi:hypothetical protein